MNLKQFAFENCFHPVIHLSFLEIIYLLNVGLASYNQARNRGDGQLLATAEVANPLAVGPDSAPTA